MTEPVARALAEELTQVVQAVDGVSALFPARPLWQSLAGAAIQAVTGEAQPLVGLSENPDGVSVKVRIGVGASHPAPAVARKVAEAIRSCLQEPAAVVEVSVVKIEG
ncbi:hypothetical protein ACIPY3_14405 [Paenarthrobacter sp. NPDC089714]|uniref:hypothetical protein n=1 Tax=unclassified Paenarthrobacter TaxID=2634190 RepID=UPI0037CBEE38